MPSRASHPRWRSLWDEGQEPEVEREESGSRQKGSRKPDGVGPWAGMSLMLRTWGGQNNTGQAS